MRPLTAPGTRAHPTYNPVISPILQGKLDILTYLCQAEMCIENAINLLATQKRGKPTYTLTGNDIADLQALVVAINAGQFTNNAQLKVVYEEMKSLLGNIYKHYSDLYKNDISIYGGARTDLFNSIGYYCSYCEMPLGVLANVEHKLAKRYYATPSVNWDNFLQPAEACNSAKNRWPNRQDAFQLPVSGVAPALAIPIPGALPMPVPAQVFTPVNETAIQTAALGQYIWPDDPGPVIPDPNNPGYDGRSVFKYTLYQVTYNPAGKRTNKTAIDSQSLDVWIQNNQVTRLPPFTGKEVLASLNGVPTEVELHIAPVTGQTPVMVARATNTITDLNLNRDTKQDLRQANVSDLRVPLRTAAFLQAVKAVWLLNRAYVRHVGNPQTSQQLLTNDLAFMDLLDTLMDSILTAGFWSVWMLVFRRYLRNEILPLVIAQMTSPNRFPGTRWA